MYQYGECLEYRPTCTLYMYVHFVHVLIGVYCAYDGGLCKSLCLCLTTDCYRKHVILTCD